VLSAIGVIKLKMNRELCVAELKQFRVCAQCNNVWNFLKVVFNNLFNAICIQASVSPCSRPFLDLNPC
jgi:hypothetical protein